jgi:putative hydrolase of the HAD superfamily
LKKYNHFFFDLDGTLWDLYTNTEEALRILFKEFNLPAEPAFFSDFYSKYHYHNEKVWALYRVGKIEKEVLRTIRFERAFEEAGHPLVAAEIERFADRFLDVCPKLPNLLPGAHELLAHASKNGKLHIITNGFKEVQGFKMEAGNLNQYFDQMINSEDVGKRKPNPEIFEYALKKAGATKEESIMIGDDWDADILGARDFGIDQAFITHTEQMQLKLSGGDRTHQVRHNYSPTFTVNNLSELIQHF